MAEERWLRIAARMDRVTEVCDFVVEAAEAAGLDEREVYHCQMAVDEAVTNVIEHGYAGDDENARVEIGCVVEGGDFVIKVIDEGLAFNPLECIDPDPTANLGDRTPGGWGIYFIKKMMDWVDYYYRDGRNHLVMAKAALVVGRAGADSAGAGVIWRREVEPGVWVIRPTGRLDSMTSRLLEEALEAELEAGNTCLIVDMGQVVYISSSGLKVLVSAWRKARALQGMVLVAEMQPRVSEVFDMVGFNRVFRTFPAVEDVVKAIETGGLGPGCSA